MIGLVLGDTHIGRLIISKLKLLKKNFIVIDISKKKIFKNYKNSFPLSIGQLGKAINILKKNKCKKVIFAGRVERPDFYKTKFDFKALYYLPKIIKETKKGDAYIINLITRIFLKEGLKIIRQTSFNKELLLKKGNCTKTKIDISSKKDINIAKRIIINPKTNNVGQGVIVSSGITIITETQNGTDFMLRKAKKSLNKQYLQRSKERKGILLKFPKHNQDLRTDLPTIGIKTLKLCSSIGLKGIIVKSNQNIFLDQKKCIKLANKKKMFIAAI